MPNATVIALVRRESPAGTNAGGHPATGDTYVSTTSADPVSTQPLHPVAEEPRPGSRIDRMAQPLSRNVLRVMAEHYGVCVRPLPLRRIDRVTGQTEIVDIPCGARLASKCKPCAERNRRLRQQQIREGWHLADEPMPPTETPSETVKALVSLRCTYVFERDEAMRAGRWDQVADLDAGIDELDEHMATQRIRGTLPKPSDPSTERRTRSTKRRKDAGDLPRLPVDARTIGKVYTGSHGKTYRPSTLLTITLDGYGPVHTSPRTRRGHLQPCPCGTLHGQHDPLLGTPMDPGSYDYRRAALDAVFFAAGLDRLWQNLRRAAGTNLQYAGAVEMQKRLAPHAHYAMRGTLPKALLKQVAAGTYHHVWWPPFDTAVYGVDKPPVWDVDHGAYIDPSTRQPLTIWADALDRLSEPDAKPAYVMRLGRIDARGINHGTKDAERSIRYVTKYVTKDLIEQASPDSDAQRAHFDRLHAELSTLPCSPTCANWLLYGVQPDKAKPGLVPGRCSGKVHQPKTLGFTGRRVLISRQWSGKTLTDHRADNRAWIRTVLAGALADTEDQADTEPERYYFTLARPDDPDVSSLQVRIMRTIGVQTQRKTQLNQVLHPPGAVPATAVERAA
jgi:hypothetical protein